MFLANVFDAEVINNEHEGDRSYLVFEECGDPFGLMVAMLGQIGY